MAILYHAGVTATQQLDGVLLEPSLAHALRADLLTLSSVGPTTARSPLSMPRRARWGKFPTDQG